MSEKYQPTSYPHELSVRVGCKCVYHAEKPTPILLLMKPRQANTQLICEEQIQFEPNLKPTEFEDDHLNTVYRLVMQPGYNLIKHDAIVKVPSVPESIIHTDGVVAPHLLPASVLRYTLPSRYIDSDKLFDFSWQQFGHLPDGLAKVEAICTWTHNNIEYRTGSGDSTLSASEIINRGYGVCRDLAHVTIALCRTFNIPARYATGYVPDIGVVDPGTPMDYHAYTEVYLAQKWQTFDARLNIPRIGRVKIASGYDATSCAFATLYGSATLEYFEVWSYQVNRQKVSTRTPVDLSQRLDGTEQIIYI